jgi:hypothetical protein
VKKVYDANDIAYVNAKNFQLNTVYSGDQVYLHSPSTGTYDNPKVGVNKSVTVSGLSIYGAGVNNYLLLSTSASGNVGTIYVDATSPINSTVGNVMQQVDVNTEQSIFTPNLMDFSNKIMLQDISLDHTCFSQDAQGGIKVFNSVNGSCP